MNPERTASSIAQLIALLSKSGESLPEPWTPADFVGLIGGYKDLITSIQTQDKTTKEGDPFKGSLSAEQVKAWIERHGIPGAYEAMCESAKRADAAARRGRKTSKL